MAVTNPKNGSCFWCIKIVKWMPVLFISALLCWSYYAYVFQLCIVHVKALFEQIVYLICYHLLFIMLCWSYWQTIFTDIGRVPTRYKVENDYLSPLTSNGPGGDTQCQLLEEFSRNLQCNNISPQGSVRYCDKCQIIKPDRAHHCSVCGECVLKMDHHCPWINNCVSFTNYKFFLLFLGYALAYCSYVSLTSLSYFIAFWKGDLKEDGRFHILFLFFIGVMFGVSLISLFCYHCYLVCENRTTLEAFHPPIFKNGPDKCGFNIGCGQNFQQVFGDDMKTWFIPVQTSKGDGVEFPVNARHQSRTASEESVQSC